MYFYSSNYLICIQKLISKRSYKKLSLKIYTRENIIVNLALDINKNYPSLTHQQTRILVERKTTPQTSLNKPLFRIFTSRHTKAEQIQRLAHISLGFTTPTHLFPLWYGKNDFIKPAVKNRTRYIIYDVVVNIFGFSAEAIFHLGDIPAASLNSVA